jgi:pSer/pThr/pTyr-binding forkhead associated (FHA) protein
MAERKLTGWVNRIHWPHRRLAPQANAYLTRLTELNPAADTAVPIPITADELTFGCDPQQATLVLDDHSVDGLHARLVRKEDGSFWLADEGSIAGTWVNYSSVSKVGLPLEHGDLIHIGRVNFRFTQRDPLRQRKPVISMQEKSP